MYYDVRQDKPAHKESAYCFPENLYYPLHAGIACREVSILHYGKPDAKQVPDSLGKQKMWHYLKVFNYPIDCRKDTTILDFSFYLEKVKKYRIYLHSTTDVWVYKDFECSFEGFQYPVQISLSAVSTSAVSRIPSIDKLFLVVNKDEEDKKGPVFIVNKFVVADRVEQEKTFLHPFWDRLFHRPVVDSVFSYINNDPALFRNTFYRPLWSQLYLKRDKEDEEEIPLLKEVLALALQDYPFYDEKGIKKKVILEKLQELYDTQYLFSGEKQFLEALACFLQTEINDGHFFLKLPSSGEEKQLSPVRLYEIGKKIIVSAVFDSTYISQLPLGTEVLAIDGQKVEACIEDLKLAQYEVEERKRARAIALLLNRKPGDSVILTVKSRAIGEKREVKLNYPGSISIPANFRFPHALFEQKEGIAYFRIARMDGQVFLRFVNHFKEIKQSKGLILDLRGNGGGSPDGEILFSTFIQQPLRTYEQVGEVDLSRRINRGSWELVRMELSFRMLKKFNRWAEANNKRKAKLIFKFPKPRFDECICLISPYVITVGADGYTYKCWEYIHVNDSRVQPLSEKYQMDKYTDYFAFYPLSQVLLETRVDVAAFDGVIQCGGFGVSVCTENYY